ncbi:hypothetical protein Ga0100231_016330 [Opitutaceae bacterium TAV4]|nr:hypothetical protein Ga0100231_016330 [Opitutaceae bacterium TAV4]
MISVFALPPPPPPPPLLPRHTMTLPLRRIVILGDPHISPDEHTLWRDEIIPDINSLAPDLVLCVGDLTGGHVMGTATGTTDALALLTSPGALTAPFASIIGNHDLQSHEFTTDPDAVRMMRTALGRPDTTAGFVIEHNTLAIIGLDNTRWRQNTVNKNEIVIDDAQLDWWRAQLTRLADNPILMIGHAPPIGSGLMVMPELHARVGNAHINQNHTPGAIQQIIWENPNILFWFSGHNHLGHHYRDSLSQRLGVHYVHTGTASRTYARDAHRHSRILDLAPDHLTLRTYDHDLRTIDPALDHTTPHSLPTLVAHRRQFHQRRFVPTDPVTMQQPSPTALRSPPGNRRFVFLSDPHIALPIPAVTRRVIAWCARQIRAIAPDHLILGGDIIQHPDADEITAFWTALGITDIPAHYLPGNKEGPAFTLPPLPAASTPPPALTRGCVQLIPHIFLLATSDQTEVNASLETLLTQLAQHPADQTPCLVFAHFHPEATNPELVARLATSPVSTTWICGHRHNPADYNNGNLRVVICAGLDALKVCHTRPELLCIDWPPATPDNPLSPPPAIAITRHAAPAQFVHSPAPIAGRFPIGIAFRGDAPTLLRTIIDEKIPALQFHYNHTRGEPTPDELQLIADYRRTIPGGHLSLHLPNFPHPLENPNPNLDDYTPWLHWAAAARLDDLTLHLPNAPASYLFSNDGGFLDTPWTRACLATCQNLATRALAMGAQISFENVYNKKDSPPGAETLGTRPWHLTHFIKNLRHRLAAVGHAPADLNRVGIIFDAGHAAADVHISQHHGIADWLHHIAPYLQLAHIHQVVTHPDGRSQNHQAITDLASGRINYTGLLATLADTMHAIARPPIPLLIEVRERDQALLSWRTLSTNK